MTLATLNHINDLLVHDVEITAKAKKAAYDALDQARADDAKNVETLRQVYQAAKDRWDAARSALQDFESQDW